MRCAPRAVSAVSYTHLDVYKRQAVAFALACGARLADAQYFTTSRTLLDPAGHPFCLDNGQPEAPQHG